MVPLVVLPPVLYLPLLAASVLAVPLSLGLFIRSLVRRHPRALWSMAALFSLGVTVLLLSGAVSVGAWTAAV